VGRILDKAAHLGYPGEDAFEACEFIINRLSEMERQTTLEQVSQELEKARLDCQRQQGLYANDKAKYKKRVRDLRTALAQQQKTGSQREEELHEEIRRLEQRIRELTEELETANRVREELGRIGRGFSADRKALKGKLSDNEMKFLTFVEKMMQQERETQKLHEEQKQMREQLLGDAGSKSSKG
jgi:chromosome segregation ATPase